jgi:hypothetical protein
MKLRIRRFLYEENDYAYLIEYRKFFIWFQAEIHHTLGSALTSIERQYPDYYDKHRLELWNVSNL